MCNGGKRAKSFLFQSPSMNLQRRNALCVMRTLSHHKKLEDINNLGTISTQEEQFKTYLLHYFQLSFHNILSDCHYSDVTNNLLNAFRLKKQKQKNNIILLLFPFIFLLKSVTCLLQGGKSSFEWVMQFLPCQKEVSIFANLNWCTLISVRLWNFRDGGS